MLKHLKHLKTGKFGHLHIQENHIRFLLIDCFQSFKAIIILPDDFHLFILLQVGPEQVPGRFFIFYDDCFKFFHHCANIRGNNMLTENSPSLPVHRTEPLPS